MHDVFPYEREKRFRHAAHAPPHRQVLRHELARQLELASFIVTTLALPFAILFFAWEQRKERDNEEEEQYQLLSDAYIDFLGVVLANPDLHLRTNEPSWRIQPAGTARAHAGHLRHAHLPVRARLPGRLQAGLMGETERRRWNSWDDDMREWCRREDFHNALPLLLRGEDPEFQDYIRRVAKEERGPIVIPT